MSQKSGAAKPSFTVIQTSSSHEPFNVPFKKLENPAANAFAYTDSVVGDFLKELRRMPNWDNTLVVMVPDHYGAYPENLTDMKERHHIPIIFTGGALKVHGTDDTLMSQSDIAPTLLTLMDIDAHQFFFGRNILDLRNPPMVYMYDKEWAFLQSSEGEAVLNTATMEAKTTVVGTNGIINLISPFNPRTQLKAWMQAVADAYTPN